MRRGDAPDDLARVLKSTHFLSRGIAKGKCRFVQPLKARSCVAIFVQGAFAAAV
jgi:hypothetical protein